ncbi:MAG: tryptophan--tRNA ligase [Verrucomicrobiota bacterium]|nr:tryptophan--tRNA ligase [Verrucomicrobiota bacterium]
MSTEKKVVLTCAQPTGRLHLGNYLGAVRNWVKLIEEYECYYGIVDLHAITLPYVPAELRKSCLETLALYIACGLDPARCHLFLQSHVTGHTELSWVLGCITPLGQLERMTQFKDKSRNRGESVGSGLLFYPVLMAADILLYNADFVPVGEDQKQHVELCRDIAEKFNTTYSDTFKLPEPLIPAVGARIKSLQDPTRKMSKSDENQNGCLYLLDEPAVLRKKIMSAVTDSGSEILAREDKPGVSNLLTILSAVTGREIADLETEYNGQVNYGQFKAAVADAVVVAFEPIQQRYKTIVADKAYLEGVMKTGAEAAQRRANRMMSKVYRKCGFIELPR